MRIFLGQTTLVSTILFLLLLILGRFIDWLFADPTNSYIINKMTYMFSFKIILRMLVFIWTYAITTYFTLIYSLPNKRS